MLTEEITHQCISIEETCGLTKKTKEEKHKKLCYQSYTRLIERKKNGVYFFFFKLKFVFSDMFEGVLYYGGDKKLQIDANCMNAIKKKKKNQGQIGYLTTQ